jgi:hypothetical protein
MTEQHLEKFETIRSLKPQQVLSMSDVRQKYIEHYNRFHLTLDGEFQWNRSLMYIQQYVQSAPTDIDPLSVYFCIVTLAAHGISVDPQDEEVYLISYSKKLTISRQAGYYVKRLVSTNQIAYVIDTKLVYEGDLFTVKNGKVEHEEKFASDIMIAGYTKLMLPNNIERHIVYRKSDWESWRKASPQSTGSNWQQEFKLSDGRVITQPKPGFLKTKILAHALKDKANGWKPGRAPVVEGVTEQVFQDDADGNFTPTEIAVSDIPETTPHEEVAPAQIAAPVLHTTQQVYSQQKVEYKPTPTPTPTKLPTNSDDLPF